MTGDSEDGANQASGSRPDGLPPLREVIAALGLDAKKSLGQNFILDLNLTRRIARVAAPFSGLTVIEVGPGPGGLTRALFLEGAEKIIAIEADMRCAPVLAALSAHYPDRLNTIIGDATTVDWKSVAGAAAGRCVIVANLPYNVATRLLIGWLETEPWPPWWVRMALMFQKEVADRIVAAPGTKAYGRLSVIAQWRTRCRIALTLKPDAFTPPPKVASAVVEFHPHAVCEPRCDVLTLGRVTAAAFGQRRKMLRQSLRSMVSDPGPILRSAGIDPTARAEELLPSDFARLASLLDAQAALRSS